MSPSKSKEGHSLSKRVFVIAEAGVNHNGKAELAFQLVDAAVEAGADAIKFQTFVAEKVAVPNAPKAGYQVETTGSADSQVEMLRRLELTPALHHELAARCRTKGIEFLSTPFDEESVDFLVEEVRVKRLKVASGEITNGPLLLHMARSGRPLIVSTGMSHLEEVETALGVLAFAMTADVKETASRAAFAAARATAEGQSLLAERIVLLHCTSEYPAPYDQTNLRAMDTLKEKFGLPVGLSDHTVGTAVPLAAVARGAVVIEKHLTLDRSLSGPDHAASLEPSELAAMVAGIRAVEQALGSPDKVPAAAEQANLPVVRRSLVALTAIRNGDRFTETNIGARRPGTGLSPMGYWEMLGRPAGRSYAAGELIEATGELIEG